jgi:hypothetical protein
METLNDIRDLARFDVEEASKHGPPPATCPEPALDALEDRLGRKPTDTERQVFADTYESLAERMSGQFDEHHTRMGGW